MAWSACNDLHKIWVSNLNTKIKINIFKTIIEHKQQNILDGTYIRLLMRVKYLSWKQHPTLKQIYNNHPTILPRVSNVIKHWRVQFAGHSPTLDKTSSHYRPVGPPRPTENKNSVENYFSADIFFRGNYFFRRYFFLLIFFSAQICFSMEIFKTRPWVFEKKIK
jgi:hypothetical protein